MIRSIALLAVLALIGALAMGCDQQRAIVDPEANTAADAKAHPIPDEPDALLVAIDAAFETTQFMRVDIVVQRSGGGFHAYPPGYPPSTPITVTIPNNSAALSDGLPLQHTCEIWVPVVPADGSRLDLPGDAVIYKTRKYPPENVEDIILSLPLLPCYGNASRATMFRAYSIGETPDGDPIRENVELVEVPMNPTETPYLEIHGDPGSDDVEDTTKGATEPTEAGGGDG
jgi:hypothetical protein